jgi:hypothetical protein
VRIYLDLCCLKRPFDAQEQSLVRLQTEAVIDILALPVETAELIRASAQVLENSLNPVQARREAVALWLAQAPVVTLSDEDLIRRTADLIALGFKNFDAFHLASAELSGADVFLTVDLPLLKLATRLTEKLHLRVADPVRLLEELSEWTH